MFRFEVRYTSDRPLQRSRIRRSLHPVNGHGLRMIATRQLFEEASWYDRCQARDTARADPDTWVIPDGEALVGFRGDALGIVRLVKTRMS